MIYKCFLSLSIRLDDFASIASDIEYVKNYKSRDTVSQNENRLSLKDSYVLDFAFKYCEVFLVVEGHEGIFVVTGILTFHTFHQKTLSQNYKKMRMVFS
jgi:hypothetical protein